MGGGDVAVVGDLGEGVARFGVGDGGQVVLEGGVGLRQQAGGLFRLVGGAVDLHGRPQITVYIVIFPDYIGIESQEFGRRLQRGG